ncbi:radical SAM protein [Geobacter benzoatilyticus]|uniref:Radical SAM protein n=1 Tax=Geobacter benzoatilyticus TaxID=2815309 RepID=A0ABX7Q1G4_9BACT|nr:radical SAM protein [Geobacter benzoatilyticus]QSV44933.1 radical SAM protein [Geobacter benzoatilyticus]
MERTRRVKIVTGLKCNIRCVFCYYRDNLDAPNRDMGDILRDVAYAVRRGVKEIDFSGGEPTVHPDLPRLIAEVKQQGINRVCIITNGWRLAERSYLKQLKEAGLDEILFSVHGHTGEIHDTLTSTPGSFNRLLKALGNVTAEGLILRTNTVVNSLNVHDLSGLGRLLLEYEPAQVNFITINDWCFAKHLVDKLMVRYSEMAPALRGACDLLAPRIAAVNVRYIPFCFMQGYERHVCNHRQVSSDPYEWVPRVRARLEEGTSVWRYLGILGYGLFACGALWSLGRNSLADILDQSVVEGLRRWFYTKRDECGQCQYRELCDGVENTYASQFGLDELKPLPGSAITDPVHFRSGAQMCCRSGTGEA